VQPQNFDAPESYLQGVSQRVPQYFRNIGPSSAMAKDHMKQPRNSICSTCHHLAPVAQPAPPVLPLFDIIPVYPGPAYGLQPGPNVIMDVNNKSIANIFCFGAFADRISSIVYHNHTGLFPFTSFDGSVCFFVLYHYESNAILVMPIAGLDNMSISTAYKTYFEELTAKGFKPKQNIMDNKATKHIENYLTKNKCKLQVMEPHNHRVNDAKCMIQTFKAAFIAALATTDSDFPLQLWD
jgi:hypothetical protein